MKAVDPTLLGLTRDQVRERLGEPDDVGVTSRKHRSPKLWLYGSVEVSFGTSGRVELIFDDDAKGGSGQSITSLELP